MSYIISSPTGPQGMEVDSTFNAARMSIRPLDYGLGGQTLGHYAVAQRSGEIAATLAAGGDLARLRWAPTLTTAFAVLTRIKIGLSVSASVTAGTIEQAYKAYIVRGFTVDYTTAITSVNLSTTQKTNQMRGSMSQSQMGAGGPGICTTVVMSGATRTPDAAPFAIGTFAPLLTATNATGTAVLLPQGTQTQMMTLYEWTGLGQHPVILASNEGILIQNQLAGYATGTFALYVQWEWAEIGAF